MIVKKVLITMMAIIAMTFTMTGCQDLFSKDSALDQDTMPWGGADSEKNANGKTTVTLEADKYDVDWLLWTTYNGIVVKNPNISSDKLTAKVDDKIVFTFENDAFDDPTKAQYFILYIAMDTFEPSKDADNPAKGKCDFRGSVNVKPGYNVTIKASKYKQYLKYVGMLNIEHTEQQATSTWTDGDYTITEIWPLEPAKEGEDEIGKIYSINGSIKYEKHTITLNQIVTIVVKSDEDILLGLYQPNRNKTTGGADANPYTMTLTDEQKTSWNVSTWEDYADANINSLFAKKVKLERHKTYSETLDSYHFNEYRFNYKKGKDKVERTKFAEGSVYLTADEIDLVAGSFEP